MLKAKITFIASVAAVALMQIPDNHIIVENGNAGIELVDVFVSPYVRSDGTYVRGHIRSDPDGIPYNNYSYGR